MKKNIFTIIGITILVISAFPLDVAADEIYNSLMMSNQQAIPFEETTTTDSVDSSTELENTPSVEETTPSVEETTTEEDTSAVEDNNEVVTNEETTPQTQSLGIKFEVFVKDIGWQKLTGSTTTNKEMYALKFPSEYKNKFSYRAHIQNFGWTEFVNPGTIIGTPSQKRSIEAIEIKVLDDTFNIAYKSNTPNWGWLDYQTNSGKIGSEGLGVPITGLDITTDPSITTGTYPVIIKPQLSGEAHVERMGWLENDSTTFGTTGKLKRLEALKLNIDNSQISGDLEYKGHVQNVGWQNPVNSGGIIGTEGKGLRLESVNIKLTGDLSKYLDLYYRVHVEGMGWLPWASSGMNAGTDGYGLRTEAVEVKIEPKNSNNVATSVMAHYSVGRTPGAAHIQRKGWTNINGTQLGTTGQGLQIEAIRLSLSNTPVSGNIEYQTHVAGKGWVNWSRNGQTNGTEGQGIRTEAVRIKLSGDAANYYDVYYRAHVQGFGWLGWTSNGREAGTEAYCYRLEALQVEIVPKSYKKYKISNDAFRKYVKPSKIQYIPPYYAQGDRRWGSRYYGMGNMASTGCVPTAIASAVSGVLGRQVLPTEIADYLYHNTSEFNRINVGASGLAFKLGVERYGIPTRGLANGREVNHALSRGQIVLAMVGSNSPFIRGGTHAVVLYGWDPAGLTNVLDPNDSRKNGVYRTEDIMRWQSGDPYDWRGGYVFYSVGFNSWNE